MRGTYNFYQDGRLIGSHENLITDSGKKLILRYLAGQVGNIGEALAVGVGENTPAGSDYRLTFEVERARIVLKSVDYVNNNIIFKCTLPQSSTYTIYESALWSNFTDSLAGQFNGRILTAFDLSNESWTNSTTDTSTERVSPTGAKITVAGSATTSTRTTYQMDLSGYSANDEFTLAFIKNSAYITALSLIFENTSGGAFRRTIDISGLSNGYHVISFRKGDFAASGTIDWANIQQYGVDATAAATGGNIILDGIRAEDTDTTNPSYTMVSKSVLPAPIVKTSVSPMDVEYVLDLNFT